MKKIPDNVIHFLADNGLGIVTEEGMPKTLRVIQLYLHALNTHDEYVAFLMQDNIRVITEILPRLDVTMGKNYRKSIRVTEELSAKNLREYDKHRHKERRMAVKKSTPLNDA